MLTLNDTIEMLCTHKKRHANTNTNANFDAHCEWTLRDRIRIYPQNSIYSKKFPIFDNGKIINTH